MSIKDADANFLPPVETNMVDMIPSTQSATGPVVAGPEQPLGGSLDAGEKRRSKVLHSAYLHSIQHRHFILFNVIPLLATMVALASIPLSPPTAANLACFILLWGITQFCIVAGYHRYFSHRSYKAHKAVEIFLQIGAMLGGQGGAISWVALHRRHHECSDKEGDPHSPRTLEKNWWGKVHGIAHSQFFWMYQHDYPNVMYYAADLMRNKTVVRLDQYYFHFVAAGLLVPGLICAYFEPTLIGFLKGVLWGGLVRICALGHAIGAVNSLLHTFGSRAYNTADNSRNSALFSLLTFGDSWHNNHHAFPRSASAGLLWYRPDPAFWIIKLLSIFHLTWDIYVPNRQAINRLHAFKESPDA